MMLAETLRAELARIDGAISKLRWQRARVIVEMFRPGLDRAWWKFHFVVTVASVRVINAEIAMWKHYRQTLF